MDEKIISAIIGASAGILIALIGLISNFALNKKIRPSRLINNSFRIPSPGVCSSENKATVDTEEGYWFSFNFSN